MATLAKAHAEAALALLWPPLCPRCEARAQHPREHYCESCWARLRPLRDPEAPRLHAAFAVDSLFLEMLGAGKYRGCRAVLQRLAQDAAERLRTGIPQGVLIPVPLAATRRRERGFNQSEIFAGRLAAQLGYPVEKGWVQRRGGGTPLAGLPRKERAEAIAGKFRVSRRFLGSEAPPLLLVDDVFTTGSTLGDCERALAEAGGRVHARIVMGRAFGAHSDHNS
ncbi:MAG TPA: double zinc ribbon domain-containing protein [bacterium]|nr:double zinc ribbon domain-containing protein [bacterium]